jgi:hypothetical protein
VNPIAAETENMVTSRDDAVPEISILYTHIQQQQHATTTVIIVTIIITIIITIKGNFFVS